MRIIETLQPIETLMSTRKIPPVTNSEWFPNPIKKHEVKIELHWSADERTRHALERQTAVMGFETPADYLHQLIAATLAGNDQSTVVGPDGRLECAGVRGRTLWVKDV
jgi:hypothetical protein